MRREVEVSLPSGVAQGEEESRFCIAKNGHGLAGVKFGTGYGRWMTRAENAGQPGPRLLCTCCLAVSMGAAAANRRC